MTDNEPQFGKKYTFYREKFVINFQAVISQKKFNTVNIEIAPVNNKKAAWDNKITLQLSEVDLYKFFYTVSHGVVFKYQSKFHGTDNNKSILFNESAEGCNITVSEKGKTMHFMCTVGEWFYCQMLMLEQFLCHPLSLSEAKSLLLTDKKSSLK